MPEMLTRLDKAPFPWFGGKSKAADPYGTRC